MDRLATLELEGNTAELDRIRLNSPKAVPGPLMRTLWKLLLNDRLKPPGHNPDLYSWFRQLKMDGLSITMRFKLRELLAPKVLLRKPIRWDHDASVLINRLASDTW